MGLQELLASLPSEELEDSIKYPMPDGSSFSLFYNPLLIIYATSDIDRSKEVFQMVRENLPENIVVHAFVRTIEETQEPAEKYSFSRSFKTKTSLDIAAMMLTYHSVSNDLALRV